MRDRALIVFCYDPAYVTAEVLAAAQAELPDNFELAAIEAKASRVAKQALYARADFLMLFSADPTLEEFEFLEKVKLIQLLSAGYNKFDMATANGKRIPVANNHGNSIAVAESAVLLMLALLKKLPLHHQTTREGQWLEHRFMPQLGELAGRTVGLIGMGHVGREVVRRIRGFGAWPIYYDIRRLQAGEEEELGLRFVGLERLLTDSDIVSIHAALTPKTRRLIGPGAFDLMKRTAYLVNTSRGEIVDQGELYRRLVDRRIAGAALDVFDPEPPNSNDPLLLLENVIVTPHMAGATLDTWARRLRISYGNFKRVMSGHEAEFIVNPDFH